MRAGATYVSGHNSATVSVGIKAGRGLGGGIDLRAAPVSDALDPVPMELSSLPVATCTSVPEAKPDCALALLTPPGGPGPYQCLRAQLGPE